MEKSYVILNSNIQQTCDISETVSLCEIFPLLERSKGKPDLPKYFHDVYLVHSMVQELCRLPVQFLKL